MGFTTDPIVAIHVARRPYIVAIHVGLLYGFTTDPIVAM